MITERTVTSHGIAGCVLCVGMSEIDDGVKRNCGPSECEQKGNVMNSCSATSRTGTLRTCVPPLGHKDMVLWDWSLTCSKKLIRCTLSRWRENVKSDAIDVGTEVGYRYVAENIALSPETISYIPTSRKYQEKAFRDLTNHSTCIDKNY